MKTKEKPNALKEKKIETMIDTFDGLTDEELVQVIGGIGGIDENALTTFNGKILSDASHNMKITATSTVLFSEPLDSGAVATSKFTELTDRNSKALGIEDGDIITIS